MYATLLYQLRFFSVETFDLRRRVDVLETDKLGKLSMSRAGCKERDRYVFSLCQQHGLPVVVCLGGGYSPQISHIVEAHCNTFRLAQEMWF